VTDKKTTKAVARSKQKLTSKRSVDTLERRGAKKPCGAAVAGLITTLISKKVVRSRSIVVTTALAVTPNPIDEIARIAAPSSVARLQMSRRCTARLHISEWLSHSPQAAHCRFGDREHGEGRFGKYHLRRSR
jgi:hypothetical protein